ncbi:MAG: tetratricopeptide repeat protein [Chloroflexota bacterium]
MKPEEEQVPPVYSELCRRGADLAQEGKWSEALVLYEQCIQVYSKGIEAWHEKAGVLNRLGRHEEALEAFERVIELRVKQELTEYGGMNILGRWVKRIKKPSSDIPGTKDQK